MRSTWGYEIYMSPGKSDARGVAILFNPNFEFTVINEHKDTDGNLLILEIQIEQFTLCLINIYGPNRDNPQFFEELEEKMLINENDFIVIGGDWNLIQDSHLDCYNYININNPKARDQVLHMKNTLNLKDPWRINNIDKKCLHGVRKT